MQKLGLKRKGAMAFEFIIVLVIFVATALIAAPIIQKPINRQTTVISSYIAGCDEDPSGLAKDREGWDLNPDVYYQNHTQSRYCPGGRISEN